MASNGSATRRLGLILGLVAAFFLIYQVQRFFDSLHDLPGPAVLEPVAHEGAAAIGFAGDSRTLLTVGYEREIVQWSVPGGSSSRRSLAARGLFGRADQVFLDARSQLCALNFRGFGRPDVAILRLDGTGGPWRPAGLWWGSPSTNGRFLFGFQGPDLVVYSVQTRRPVKRRRLQGRSPRCLDIDPQARWIAWASSFGAWVMPLDGGPAVMLAQGRWADLPWIEFSPDGRRVGLQTPGPEGRSFRTWECGTWSPGPRFETGPNSRSRAKICLFHFSPDGRRIVTPVRTAREYLVLSLGLERRKEHVDALQAFDVTTGRPLFDWSRPDRVRGHPAPVRDCAWSPDGNRLASLGQDGRIALWDAREGRFLRFLDSR